MSAESDEQDESSQDTTTDQVTWDTQHDFCTVEFLQSSPESDEQDESSHDATIDQVTWDTQHDFFTVEFLQSSPTQAGFYRQNIIHGAFYKTKFSNLSILFWSLLPNNDNNGNFAAT